MGSNMKARLGSTTLRANTSSTPRSIGRQNDFIRLEITDAIPELLRRHYRPTWLGHHRLLALPKANTKLIVSGSLNAIRLLDLYVKMCYTVKYNGPLCPRCLCHPDTGDRHDNRGGESPPPSWPNGDYHAAYLRRFILRCPCWLCHGHLAWLMGAVLKHLALALALCALSPAPLVAHGGYGGPPMWDRGPNPEYRRPRIIPPGRPYGPQYGPCIYHGDCRGPRDRDFNDPRPYPIPPRRDYDDWEG